MWMRMVLTSLASKGWTLLPIVVAVLPAIPRSRSQVEPCDFCVRRGDFVSMGRAGWAKVSL
jgi:hypothetical protein